MLDGEKLVGLLGHASVHGALDDLLSASGIKARPKGADTPNLISQEKFGIAFEYRAQADFEESVGTPLSTGKFILREVDFYDDGVDDFTGFAGKLPFGVVFATNESGAASVFGAPRKSLAGDEEDGPQHIYCFDGKIVVVKFAVAGKKIDWLRVGLPTNSDRRLGYCG